MKKIVVYVAGPLSNGGTCDNDEIERNIKNTCHTASMLLEMGFSPIVPHLTHYWHLLYPNDYEKWLELGVDIMLRCDCVFRMDGESAGADVEVDAAVKDGMPVFTSIPDMCEWRLLQEPPHNPWKLNIR